MLKVSRFIAVALVATGLSSVAAAQGFDNRRLFFGGGLSQNSISNFDNATGFQIFGGYNFPALARNFYVDAEAGYMDTGKFKRRSEEHTSELQSQSNLVCRLLLEKKKSPDDLLRSP